MKKLLSLLLLGAFLCLAPAAKAQTTATIIDSGNVLKITLDGKSQYLQKNNLLVKLDGPYLQIKSSSGTYLQNILITAISTPSHATDAALLGTIRGYLNTVQSQTVTVSDTVFRNGHNNIHIGNLPPSPSTSTLQTAGNTSLSSLDTKLGEVQASPTSNTVLDRLKQIYTAITGTLTVGTHAVTQSGTWTVQPGNTANTTAWKVDGSAVTQPVSGTFWQATQPVSGTVAISNTGFYVTGYLYNHISSQTTTNVCSGAGVLHAITVNKTWTGTTITVYDNTSASGNVIAIPLGNGIVTLIYDVAFTTGLTIVTAGAAAGDITVTYKQ